MKKSLILLGTLITFNLSAETIIIKGDEWCPFNCQSNGKNKGYMIDLAKIIFERNSSGRQSGRIG
jgi:hypothetical protein